MTKPKYWEEGKKYLSKKDKILKELIKKYPGHLKSRKDPFFSLCKSIVGQQISVQAANSVWKKLETKSKKIPLYAILANHEEFYNVDKSWRNKWSEKIGTHYALNIDYIN